MKYIRLISYFLSVLIVTCVYSKNNKPINHLSDDFDDALSLEAWTNLSLKEGYPNKINIVDINKTKKRHLYIKPKESIWFEGYHGTFLYKEVSGDFVVSTKLSVSGVLEDFPDYPKKTWQIAGILVREPIDVSVNKNKREENWVFNTYGSGIGRKHLIDIGTNQDNIYTCYPFTGKDGSIELRIVRIDEYIITLSKNQRENWVLRKIIKRTDFSQTLQVGIMTNSSGYHYPFAGNLKKDFSYFDYNSQLIDIDNKPDLQVYIDYVYYKRPSIDKKQLTDIIGDGNKILSYFND